MKIGNQSGTCFSLDIERKQYVVTAKHLTNGWKFSNEIQIFHENKWKNMKFDLVGQSDDPVDIAVLAPPLQLSPSYPLEACNKGMISGQDIYFLGFPYLKFGNFGKINRDFPSICKERHRILP